MQNLPPAHGLARGVIASFQNEKYTESNSVPINIITDYDSLNHPSKNRAGKGLGAAVLLIS